MSINAALKSRPTRHRQLHQHPQERMKTLQVRVQPARDFVDQEVPFVFAIPDLLNLLSIQHCLRFKCALRCLRCLSITTVAEAADTRPCPTTTRSFCSTPSIRVSWSLAQSQARSEHPALNQLTTHQSVLVSFPVLSLPLQAMVSFKLSGRLLCHCRRGFGRMLMET